MFNIFKTEPVVKLNKEDFKEVTNLNQIDRVRNTVHTVVGQLVHKQKELEDLITSKQEELRQVKLSLKAMQSAQNVLDTDESISKDDFSLNL